MGVAADAMLIEAKPPGVNIEEFFLRVPVLTLATHAFTELARIEFSPTRIAHSV